MSVIRNCSSFLLPSKKFFLLCFLAYLLINDICHEGRNFCVTQGNFAFTLGLALAIVRGVAPLSTLDLTRKEKKVCFTIQSCFVLFFVSAVFLTIISFVFEMNYRFPIIGHVASFDHHRRRLVKETVVYDSQKMFTLKLLLRDTSIIWTPQYYREFTCSC